MHRTRRAESDELPAPIEPLRAHKTLKTISYSAPGTPGLIGKLVEQFWKEYDAQKPRRSEPFGVRRQSEAAIYAAKRRRRFGRSGATGWALEIERIEDPPRASGAFQSGVALRRVKRGFASRRTP